MDRHGPARVKSEVAHTPRRAGKRTDLLAHGSPESWGRAAGDTLAPASTCLASPLLATFLNPAGRGE